MAARVTEARKAQLAALSSHGNRGAQSATSADGVREAFFASLTRELRCSLDGDERFLHVEGAWDGVLGWAPGDLYGWRFEEIVHPADRGRAAKALARLRTGGGLERDVELRLALPEGGHRLTAWTFMAGPAPDCVLGLGRSQEPDPADDAEARRAITQLEGYAEVERFAGTAAHQLAEPLVIAESSAILVVEELGPDLDPQLRDRLDAIGRGAARARLLVEALLQDARSSGRPPRLGKVDLNTVVEDALATVRERLDERRMRPVVAPQPTLVSEPRLLGVIYENLLSNALKYGPREGSDVWIDAAREGDMWRLSVTSPGTPLPESERARIFEPFRRAPGERRAPGTGRGLAICARLAERLGGRMEVEPRADGNTFSLIHPAAD